MSIEGLKVVVTGKFSRGRKDIEWDLEQAGADVTSAVSSKTDILFCGEAPGSKLTKAEKLGLPVLNEAQLELLLAGRALDKVLSGKAKMPKTPVKKGAPKASKKQRAEKVAEISGMTLEGLNVVCTGTFSVPRKKLEALLTVAGANVGGSFSGKTQLLVVGEKAGSKLDKAQQVGVPCIDEEQCMRLLDGEEVDEVIGSAPKKKAKKTAKKKPAKKAAKKATKKAAKKKTTKKAKKKSSGTIDGMKVVVTGTFDLPRKEIEAALEALGADVTSSFSGKTELLVCGVKAGSKLAKAEAAGVPILDADQLEELLSGTPLKKLI